MRHFPGRCSIYVLSVVIVIDAIWLTVGGISVTFSDRAPGLFLLAPLTFITLIRLFPPGNGPMAQMVRRLGIALQGIVFIFVAWMAATVLNHLLMTTRYPYADSMLATWGKALGFDWLSYFQLVLDNPVLQTVLGRTYSAFMPASLIAFVILALTESLRRAAYTVEAFFISSVVCIACGTLFPAEGASALFLRGVLPEETITSLPGLYHLESLHRLREEPLRELDPLKLMGLVTFPSFHTAGGLVIATALWRTRWFWPAAVYTLIMIASTPIYGAHYVIDLVAGAAVAAAVLLWLASRTHYRGVLQSAPSEARVHP